MIEFLWQYELPFKTNVSAESKYYDLVLCIFVLSKSDQLTTRYQEQGFRHWNLFLVSIYT